VALAALAAAVGIGACPAAAEDLPPLAWTRLRMQAAKALVLRGSVEVNARRLPAAEAPLGACAEGEGRAVGAEGAILITGTADSTVSKPTRSATVLDAASLGVLQTEELRPGKKLKQRRFLRAGDHVWRRAPDDRGDRKADPTTWPVYRDEHESWPEGGPFDLPVTDGHALLYQAAASRLDREGATLDVLLWTHERLVMLHLRATDRVMLPVDFQRRGPDGWSRVDAKVPARRVAIDVEPVSPEGEPEELDVLGMKRGVEMYLEEGTGLPLEVRGQVSPVGDVAVRLTEAE